MTMIEPKAKIPSVAPAGVSDETFGQLVGKSPRCARLGIECRNVDEHGNFIPCESVNDNNEYAVEVDHIIPRSSGGSNSLDNLQLLCACENRRKYNRPDSCYEGTFYFDEPIHFENLRDHQRLLAYRHAVNTYRKAFESPERLLSRFMLLAWLVGAGKTIGMASILFGINHVRKSLNGGSAWRIKKVLWLVHQRSLVTSLAKELREDLVNYRIAEYSPKVVEVEDASRWEYLGDIVVACPQALWDADNNNLDDLKRADILSQFDAIVVDEAHWAVGRYIELARLSPRSFKFAVTSTPMDASGVMLCDIDHGAFKNWFVLYSAFGYQAGRLAGFYKNLVTFAKGIDKTYIAETGGDAVIVGGDQISSERNTTVENNAYRSIALVQKAISYSEADSERTNFDHQVMVRVESISYAKSLEKALNSNGYKVCGVWSGAKGPNLGHKNHPWMLSKQHRGRIPPNGIRTVITVDIGQFGINQPYCSAIVWISPNTSQIEIVQRIGRAIRRVKGQDDADIRLFWHGAKQDFGDAIEKAIDYILNMEERLGGFLTMANMSETDDPAPIEIQPAERGIIPEDRIAIASLIGSNLASGLSEDAASSMAIADLRKKRRWDDQYTDRATEFAEVLKTEEGRQKALRIPTIFEPSRVVLTEEPDTEYSDIRLISCLESRVILGRLSEDSRQHFIRMLKSGDDGKDIKAIREAVSLQLREIDEKTRNLNALTFYKPSHIVFGTIKDVEEHKLPFKSYYQELLYELRDAFSDYRVRNEVCAKEIKNATADYYGSKIGFKEEWWQPFAGQLSDALMREEERRRIMAKARFYVLKRHADKVPGLAERFKHELAGWPQ